MSFISFDPEKVRETFAVGDIVDWKAQDLDEDDVIFLLEHVRMGMTEPFQVDRIEDVEEEEIPLYGHHQVLNIQC